MTTCPDCKRTNATGNLSHAGMCFRAWAPGAASTEDCLHAQLAAVTAERDAYKRAKAENDERFMLERDAALARLATVERETVEKCAAVARAEESEWAALIAKGKGEWPKPDYVTDDVWARWQGRRNAACYIKDRILALCPSPAAVEETRAQETK